MKDVVSPSASSLVDIENRNGAGRGGGAAGEGQDRAWRREGAWQAVASRGAPERTQKRLSFALLHPGPDVTGVLISGPHGTGRERCLQLLLESKAGERLGEQACRPGEGELVEASLFENPLIRRTGTRASIACIARRASAPSIRGIAKSSTTARRRPNGDGKHRSSRPPWAGQGENPRLRTSARNHVAHGLLVVDHENRAGSCPRSPVPQDGSKLRPGRRSDDRKYELKGAAVSWFRCHRQGAAVRLHDAKHRCQSEAGSRDFGREKGLEDPRQQVRCDADPGVTHLQQHVVAPG